VIPTMQILAQDTVQNVRVALADACMELSPKLGQELALAHMVPVLMHFLRDEAAEVRLNVLLKMKALSQWMKPLATSLVPVLKELAEDSVWRVRKSIVDIFPLLAAELGADFFNKNVLETYLSMFSDRIASVRNQVAAVLGDMADALGSEWVEANIVPNLTAQWEECNGAAKQYLRRETVIFACKSVTTANTSASVVKSVVEIVLLGLADPINNVRMMAADAVSSMLPFIDPADVASKLKPALEKLAAEDDGDCKFFGGEALAKC